MFVVYYVVVFLFTFWAVSTHAATRGKPGVALFSAVVMPFALPLIPVIGLGFWLLKTLGAIRPPRQTGPLKARSVAPARAAAPPVIPNGAWRQLPTYPIGPVLRTRQAEICKEHGSNFNPPERSEPVAIAMGTLNSQRLIMVRQPISLARYGWVIWGWNDGQEGFAWDLSFQPTTVEALAKSAPQLLPYLAIDEGHEVTIEADGITCYFTCNLIYGLMSDEERASS